MTPARPAVLLLGDTLNVGGTEGQFVKLACAMDAARWDVRVACLRAEGPLRRVLEDAGVGVWSCGHGTLKPPRGLATVVGLARYLRRQRIELVHSFDFYSNLVAIPAARLAGVPVIASQRNLGELRPPLQRRLHQRVLRWATYVVVNARAIAARIQGIEPERVVVIPSGIDTRSFRSRPRPPSLSTFGTVANLHPHKGLADLIRAIPLVRARHGGVRLVVWGEGRARHDLERLVGDLELGPAVELRGMASDVRNALREMDAFVLPSLSEGCSNALLEAMASGLPVIASNVGGNPEIVEHEHSGLLAAARDPCTLAGAMMRLIEDPPLAQYLGARGAERVRTQFSLERMLERTERTYVQAIRVA